MTGAPPKKPKMSRERYNEIVAIRDAAGTNEAIPQEEWKDFWIAQKYYDRPRVFIDHGYEGQ